MTDRVSDRYGEPRWKQLGCGQPIGVTQILLDDIARSLVQIRGILRDTLEALTEEEGDEL